MIRADVVPRSQISGIFVGYMTLTETVSTGLLRLPLVYTLMVALPVFAPPVTIPFPSTDAIDALLDVYTRVTPSGLLIFDAKSILAPFFTEIVVAHIRLISALLLWAFTSRLNSAVKSPFASPPWIVATKTTVPAEFTVSLSSVNVAFAVDLLLILQIMV